MLICLITGVRYSKNGQKDRKCDKCRINVQNSKYLIDFSVVYSSKNCGQWHLFEVDFLWDQIFNTRKSLIGFIQNLFLDFAELLK